MPVNRSLLVAGSSAQLVGAAGLSWWLLHVEVPDVAALLCCSLLAITALSGFAALSGRRGPRPLRRGTYQLNLLVMAMILILGALIILVERGQGVPSARGLLMTELMFLAATPFLLSAIGVRGLQRQKG